MSDVTDDTISNLDQEVSDLLPALVSSVASSFKINGTYAPLFNNAGPLIVEIDRRLRTYEAEEPVYLRRLDLQVEDASLALRHLEISVLDLDGNVHVLKGYRASSPKNPSLQNIQFMCKRFVKSFSIRSTKDTRVSKIEVYGYTLVQLGKISDAINELYDFRNKVDEYVQSKQAEHSNLVANINSVAGQISDRKKELSDASAEFESLKAELEEIQRQVSEKTIQNSELEVANEDLNSKIVALKNNESQLKAAVNALNVRVSDLKFELSSLINDRKLISDEFTDYVKEGKSQLSLYILFSIIPLIIIFYSSSQLYSGAEKILSNEYQNIEEVFSAAIQRMPFAAVLALIVGVCFKVIQSLLSNVFTIHSQRLALAKLLVIAKDTVFSSAKDLDVDDETKFKERINIKMNMLRHYLVQELGAKFEVQDDASEKDKE